MSIANKGEKNPMFGKIGKNHPFFGKTHSEDSQAKISKAMKVKFTSKNHSFYSKLYT